MAKKPEEFLEKEAKRIGYKRMLMEMEHLMKGEITEPQRVVITDQHEKVKELLAAL